MTDTYIPNECVDFGHINVVELLHSLLYLGLVGTEVHDEHERVVVFYFLHGALRGQRVLDDAVLVQLRPAGDALARVLGPPHALEGLGPVEVDGRPYFRPELRVDSLQDRFFGLQRVRLGLGGLGGLGRRDGLACERVSE